MSQDSRKIPQDSSSLQPKETKLPPSDDPTSPRETKRARTSQESPQDSSFLSSKETVTSCSSVIPMNRDAEALKRPPDSAGSQQNLESIQNLGDVNSDIWFENPEEAFKRANDTLQPLRIPGEGYNIITQMQQKIVGMHANSIDSGQGYTNNPVAGYNVSDSSISGSIGMNAKSVDSGSSFTRDPQHADHQPSGMQGKDKEKIIMIPTPRVSVKAPSWTMTKKLNKTDVTRNQLHLLKTINFSHIDLSGADFVNLGSGKPVTVNVHDHDSGTMHMVQLEYKAYRFVLTGGWREDFVQRRGLKEGDEIGLLWDKSAFRFQFGVVSLADAKTPA